MKRTILATIVVVFLLVPFLASACTLPDVWVPSTVAGPLIGQPYTCVGGPMTPDSSGNLVPNSNACKDLCDLVCVVARVIYIAIAWVIWIILPIMFVVGGIMYMMGGANPGLLTSAKSTLKGAVIGAIIVLCAYLLVATFVQFLKITNIGGINGAPACTLAPSS